MPVNQEKRLLPNFFTIELDGIECARFSKVEGLEVETYIYEVEEGGLNTNTHKFVGRTRYPNLILENGVSSSNDLFNWYMESTLSENQVERKSGSIVMHNPNGGNEEVKRWNFFGALPCRWVGPKLGKDAKGTAIERIEIAHEKLELG